MPLYFYFRREKITFVIIRWSPRPFSFGMGPDPYQTDRKRELLTLDATLTTTVAVLFSRNFLNVQCNN